MSVDILKSLTDKTCSTLPFTRSFCHTHLLRNLNQQNLKAAAIFIAMLPIICVYPFVQKYFKKGILIGSVKG